MIKNSTDPAQLTFRRSGIALPIDSHLLSDRREGLAKATLLTIVVAGCLLAGCSDSPVAKQRSEADLSVALPSGGSDPGVLTDKSIPAPRLESIRGGSSLTAANARLASMDTQRDSKHNVEWKLNRLKQAIGPPELQNGAAESVLVQQGGKLPTELVPTPKPKIDAEVVPAPRGVREGDPNQPGPADGSDPRGATGPEDYATWPVPTVALVITGQQHGYIEPCGCTGLDRQKGGVARRMTLMKQLQADGWDLVPVDAGNQIRRIGQQASFKFSWSTEALKQMKYQSVGFGPDDLRLSAIDLLQVAAADSPDDALYVSANVVIFDDPTFLPNHKLIERGGIKIGITSVLDPESIDGATSEDIKINSPEASAQAALRAMNDKGATFRVLSFFGTKTTSEAAAEKLALAVPGFDLMIVAGGYGEPTYQPQEIEGSKTKYIVTGDKAMYAGLVGIYENPANKEATIKYARVPLSDKFGDAPAMRQLMAEYQQQLQDVGLEGLAVKPVPHSTGETYVGSAACGKCHTTALEIWEGSGHANATDSIIKPPRERGDIARHFDPECISCHVTGWNPQRYFPYESGYLSVDMKHLHGNGCENCHGPGSSHSAAEQKDSNVSDAERTRLRESMRLPLEKAREHCMQCHDLDNSPDFHEEDAFEDEYWPEIEHYGTD